MPKKNKIKYNRCGQINQWSIRNQLKIAIQEIISELPVIDNIPNNNVKLPNYGTQENYNN